VSDKVLLPLSFSSCKLACFSLLFFPSIMRLWLYTLSRFCGRGFPGWPIDKSSSPSISLHHEFNRPLFVCILSQFLLNLLIFPFCSSPLLCVSDSILCHIYVLVGSWGGKLKIVISVYIFTSRVRPTIVHLHN